MGFIAKPELQPWSWAPGATREAATVAATKPASFVTQVTKTPASAVSMKLYHFYKNLDPLPKKIKRIEAAKKDKKKKKERDICEAIMIRGPF